MSCHQYTPEQLAKLLVHARASLNDYIHCPATLNQGCQISANCCEAREPRPSSWSSKETHLLNQNATAGDGDLGPSERACGHEVMARIALASRLTRLLCDAVVKLLNFGIDNF